MVSTFPQQLKGYFAQNQRANERPVAILLPDEFFQTLGRF
jgi:hypothetical protein